MKKILFFLFGILAISSCQKDILEKKPLDIISDAVLWSDKTLIDAYLTQSYAEMTIFDFEFWPYYDLNRDDYKSGFFDVSTVSDECKDGSWWWGSQAYKKYGGLKIEGGLLEYWGYSNIRKLNIFIDRVPGSPLNDEMKKRRIAEARFLRAFSYFYMVKRYGGIPLITNAQAISDPPESLNVKRDKEEAIYNFVISEMDAIANDLPDMATDSELGHANKYAAIALKNRAALYAGSIAQFGTIQLDGILGIDNSKSTAFYQQSYDAANLILKSGKFALYNKIPDDKVANYRAIFQDKWNNEVIFARDHNNVGMQAWTGSGTGISYDFLATPIPDGWGAGGILAAYLEFIEEYEHVDGTPGKLDRSTLSTRLWTTEELWKDKDPRFFASICTENSVWRGVKRTFYQGIIGTDGQVYTVGSYNGILCNGNQVQNNCGFSTLKYLDPNNDGQVYGNSTISSQVFSYREVLLNFAEAAFELGKAGEALTAVNQIRERAGIALLTSVDRAKIRHERQIELAFEGHRYWDVRRWRTAVNDLTGEKTGLRYVLDYNTRKYILLLQTNIDGVPLRFYDYNYYLPLTIARTASNPNMVENPGY